MKRALILHLLLPALPAAGDAWFPNGRTIETTLEILADDDISVASGRLDFTGADDPWRVEAGVMWNQYSLDYVPVLFGSDESLDESTQLVDLTVSREFAGDWEASLRMRAYDGFAEYRSVWIAEYYRQLFGGFAEYEGPDPHGHALGASLRWEYATGGSATAFFDIGRDTIAPGWEFDGVTGVPQPGREVLDTLGGGISLEQAINPWLKTNLDVSVRETTDRSARYGVRNEWAAVHGEWALRLGAGYTGESPSFDAWYGDVLCEWNFRPYWYLHAGVRAYTDSGEIESAGFNALAPGLDSSEVFAGLLWDRGDLAIGGGVGFLSTDYADLDANNQFFGNLYRDRDWVTFRVSASLRF